ncbi:hypothetical protein ACGFNU_24370 [Spirillospora sp. NPDC048911]|uniref:hypothetical protein n=1 Tax=Spirillospora sp. NPDC048911 TaxID=3364527 RepID=UPI00372113DA
MADRLMPDPDAALALSEFRREVGIGLARIEGDVRLLLQRAETGDRRADALDNKVDGLDGRLDNLERITITRDELDERDKRLQERLDEQARRRLTITAIVLTIVFGALTAGIAVISIIAN